MKGPTWRATVVFRSVTEREANETYERILIAARATSLVRAAWLTSIEEVEVHGEADS